MRFASGFYRVLSGSRVHGLVVSKLQSLNGTQDFDWVFSGAALGCLLGLGL